MVGNASKFKLLVILLFLFALIIPSVTLASDGNDYPIVFVHGVGDGFNGNINYWGGFTDLRGRLQRDGHEVYIAHVGPMSSNWDRTAELFAYIKGGTVDYGVAHSADKGHSRYGRTYSGIYPEWGEINPETGNINKIHLIGHSMGGQTSRMLVQLFEEGSPDEINATPEDISSLYAGELNDWVSSVTSISTPHDGTVIADDLNSLFPMLQELIVYLSRFSPRNLFDFNLDQWGLRRGRTESSRDFYRRVWDNPVWKTDDVCLADLRPKGAAQINSWVEAQPNVYYFSIANEGSIEGFITGRHLPRVTTLPFFYPTVTMIGRTKDRSLRENDGMVSTKSMIGPTLNSNDEIVQFDGNPQIGKWNYMGKQSRYCHASIIGLFRSPPVGMYRDLANTLSSLPE